MIIRLIQKHEGQWNWYQIQRAAIDIFAEHPDLKLSEFMAEALVEETPVAGEPLSRVQITGRGRALLE